MQLLYQVLIRRSEIAKREQCSGSNGTCYTQLEKFVNVTEFFFYKIITNSCEKRINAYQSRLECQREFEPITCRDQNYQIELEAENPAKQRQKSPERIQSVITSRSRSRMSFNGMSRCRGF